jgi:hypothetical protein
VVKTDNPADEKLMDEESQTKAPRNEELQNYDPNKPREFSFSEVCYVGIAFLFSFSKELLSVTWFALVLWLPEG